MSSAVSKSRRALQRVVGSRRASVRFYPDPCRACPSCDLLAGLVELDDAVIGVIAMAVAEQQYRHGAQPRRCLRPSARRFEKEGRGRGFPLTVAMRGGVVIAIGSPVLMNHDARAGGSDATVLALHIRLCLGPRQGVIGASTVCFLPTVRAKGHGVASALGLEALAATHADHA
jgi:hypothetical protein